ncbi:MAG: hypothetical protein K2O15_05830 [Lachnospiraceae bacterium]|nr:hypothetical protein [Lachnospiraceae bacterium]
MKYYIKKKGFTHIGADIKAITDELEKGNLIGTEIPGLRIPTDGHAFKVKAANADARAGQSNRYSIIYYAVRDDAEVYLLTIYYKKVENRIPKNQEIVEVVETYCM